MKTKTPHIITENGIQYHLGELKNEYINYDFRKILIYLEAKGKLLFGENFEIFSEDEVILFKLCIYFIQEVEYAKKLNIDLQKGILLTGPVGCGKTSLMKLLRHIVPHRKPYKIAPCRNIIFSFNHLGYKAIEDYGNDGFYCFDDLGVEPTGRHYGKDCNVMGEILLSRYEITCHPELVSGSHQSSPQLLNNCHPEHSRRVLTHCTTNLNAKELEDRYGNRVRSRMRSMFNLIAFNENSKDKRN